MKKTNFYICRNDTIREIQSSFSHFYPFLEINFFSNNEKTDEKNSCVMFSPEVEIRDISPDCQDGYIELSDQMPIGEIEKLIHDHFKLHAEISTKTTRKPFTLKYSHCWPSKDENQGGVRFPDRSNISYFKEVL